MERTGFIVYFFKKQTKKGLTKILPKLLLAPYSNYKLPTSWKRSQTYLWEWCLLHTYIHARNITPSISDLYKRFFFLQKEGEKVNVFISTSLLCYVGCFPQNLFYWHVCKEKSVLKQSQKYTLSETQWRTYPNTYTHNFYIHARYLSLQSCL